MKFLDPFRRKPKTSKELGEHYFEKAASTTDPYQKKRLLLTASKYFEEAQDYDNAIKSLVIGEEEKKARTLSVKICNPSYLREHSQNRTEIVQTYMACIIKCMNENLLGKATELSKELLNYQKDDFNDGVCLAVNSLQHTNLMDLDRALAKIHKGSTEFLEEDVRRIFIKVLYDRCKEYNIFRELFRRHVMPEICPRCHGHMVFHEEFGEAVCQYCGTKIKIT